MPLDDLKQIVDENLNKVEISDELRHRIISGAKNPVETEQKKPGLIKKPIFKKPIHKYGAVFALAAACLAVFVFAFQGFLGLQNPKDSTLGGSATTEPPASGEVTMLAVDSIMPLSAKNGAISPSSAFKVKTSGGAPSTDEIKSSVSFIPAVDFSVEQTSDGEYAITPAAPLNEGEVYRMEVKALSSGQSPYLWAFQTSGALTVSSTFPVDGSSWVPVSTGIEVGFSSLVENIDGYFEISPKVEGAFEYVGRRVIFIPSESLLPDTLYTVTVKGGLTSAALEKMADFYSFSFRTATGQENRTLYAADGITASFLPQDSVDIRYSVLDYYSYPEEIKGTFELYKIPDAATYVALAQDHKSAIHPYLGRPSDYILSTDGLGLVSYGEALLFSDLNQFCFDLHFVLPQTPEEGYYLLNITPETGGVPAQKLFVISPLSVWCQSANGSSDVWVLDSAASKPAEGAEVTFGSLQSAANDSSGRVRVETGALSRQTEYTGLYIDYNGHEWAGPVYLLPAQTAPLSQQYKTAIYFDRPLYQPQDTANFWGVVIPREADTPLPQNLYLSIEGFDDIPVTLDENGAFSGSFSFEKMLYYSLQVSLMSGDDYIDSTHISFSKYTKPTYVFDLSVDKPYYRKNQGIILQGSASYFDGTPAGGLELNVGATDDNGRIEKSYSYQKGDYPLTSNEATRRWISVYTTGQEDGFSARDLSAIVFNSDYYTDVDISAKSDGFTFTLNPVAIDFDALDARLGEGEQIESILWDTQGFNPEGAAYTQEYTVEIYKNERYIASTQLKYDYVSKTNVEVHEYSYRDVFVESFTITANGPYESAKLPYVSTVEAGYWLNLTYTTPDGTPISVRHHVGYMPTDRGSDYYTLQTDKTTFGADDSVTYTLYHNTTPVKNGMLLYGLYQKDLVASEIVTSGSFTVDCAGLTSGFDIVAAYFDGTNVREVNVPYVYYDYSEMGVDFEFSTPSLTYAPKDTAEITIIATDKKGNPVTGPGVLSVVDEAYFSIAEDYYNITQALNGRIFYSLPATFASYSKTCGDNNFSEGGGEGDSNLLRKDFVDTAAFIPIVFDEDGLATASFSMPDNVTSWRLTALATNSEGRGGKGVMNISSSLPFFSNVIVNGRYALGDDISIAANCGGTHLDPHGEVTFKATVTGPMDAILESSVFGSSFANFNFGKLEKGDYTLTLESRHGDHTDIIEKSFSVVDSLFEIPSLISVKIGDLSQAGSLRYPLNVLFFNENLSSKMALLHSAFNLSSSYAMRTDALLAKALLKDSGIMSDTVRSSEGYLIEDSQLSDGALRLLPSGGDDPLLTAMALITCPGQINSGLASDYLFRVLTRSDATVEAASAAYMGLGAMGKPVLTDILQLLEHPTGFELKDQLNLAIGLGLLGDIPSATVWYNDKIAPLLVENDSGHLVLKEDNFPQTIEAAALAAIIGAEGAESLALGALTVEGDERPTPLYYILTANHLKQPAESGASSFSYTLNGQSVSVVLDEKTPFHTATFGEEALKNAALTLLEGDVSASFVSIITPADIETNTLGGIAISKHYESIGHNLFRVTLDISLSKPTSAQNLQTQKDIYAIFDVIPSGLRFVRIEDSANQNTIWHVKSEGENLSLALNPWVYSWTTDQTTFKTEHTVSFIVRKALLGEFVAEGTVIQSLDGRKRAASNPTVIEVR